MYYPLTPVFCTPKGEAEKKPWTLRFRQTFGITPMRFNQNEIRLEERCKKYSVEYIAPGLSDSVEAINERKVQLQKKCKAANDKIHQQRRQQRRQQHNAQQREHDANNRRQRECYKLQHENDAQQREHDANNQRRRERRSQKNVDSYLQHASAFHIPVMSNPLLWGMQ